MKKILTLAVLLAPLHFVNAWEPAKPTATKPATTTTAPATSTWTKATTPTGTPKSSTGGPTIGAQRTPTTGTTAPATGGTGGILGSLGSAAGALGGITGALGGAMMPKLDLSLKMNFSTIENNTKCYTQTNQPVYASDGSQVMITNGNCTTTNVSSMGKAGDISRCRAENT